MPDPTIHKRPEPEPIPADVQAKLDEARARSEELRAAHRAARDLVAARRKHNKP
jgi:hypothetical protein